MNNNQKKNKLMKYKPLMMQGMNHHVSLSYIALVYSLRPEYIHDGCSK